MAADKVSTPDYLLYNNIKLISRFEGIPANLANILREGLNPNIKVRFDEKYYAEIIYYLLNIVTPDKCKSLIVWPLIEKKNSQQFRSGVYKIVNELAKVNPGLLTKTIQPSVLMTPNGDNAVEFVWRLSLFALYTLVEKHLADMLFLFIDSTSTSLLFNQARLNLMKINITHNYNDNINTVVDLSKFITLSSYELSEMDLQLDEIEQSISKYENKLLDLIDELDLIEDFNSNESIDKRIKDCFEILQNNICEIESYVQEISKYDVELNDFFEIYCNAFDEKRRVLLNGSLIQVLTPSETINSMELYKNNELILENFLIMGIEALKILQQYETATFVWDDISVNNPDISLIHLNMSSYLNDVNTNLKKFRQLYFEFQKPVMRNKTEDENCDSMIVQYISNAQTPKLLLKKVNERWSNIGVRTRNDNTRFQQWIVEIKDKENVIALKDSEPSISIKNPISRLKPPKEIKPFDFKIGSFTEKCNSASNKKELCSKPATPKCTSTRIRPTKKLENNVEFNQTPKSSFNNYKFSINNLFTPSSKRRLSLHERTNSKLPISYNTNYNPSIDSPSRRESVKASYATPKSSVNTIQFYLNNLVTPSPQRRLSLYETTNTRLPVKNNSIVDFPSTSVKVSTSRISEEDDFLNNFKSDSIDLFEETLPTDINFDPNVSLSELASPLSKIKEEKSNTSSGSPSGIVDSTTGVQKRQCRASIEGLIFRYKQIVEKPINELDFYNTDQED